MSLIAYTEEKHFNKFDFSVNPLKKGEFERCVFEDCRFGSQDLSGFVFIDCSFKQCDLSNCALKQTGMRGVDFYACKMIGLHFEDCSPGLLRVSFKQCQLQLSSFYGMKLKSTCFEACRLDECQLVNCDLRQANFTATNLLQTHFDNCQLDEADFRGAINLELEPDNNRLQGAHFEIHQLPHLLSKYQLRIS